MVELISKILQVFADNNLFEEGVYRVYVFVNDGKGNVTSANKTISVMR
jgi:hypothetical protein